MADTDEPAEAKAEHANATAYRPAAAAFRVGDLVAIEALVHPDVVWHVPGPTRCPATCRGAKH